MTLNIVLISYCISSTSSPTLLWIVFTAFTLLYLSSTPPQSFPSLSPHPISSSLPIPLQSSPSLPSYSTSSLLPSLLTPLFPPSPSPSSLPPISLFPPHPPLLTSIFPFPPLVHSPLTSVCRLFEWVFSYVHSEESIADEVRAVYLRGLHNVSRPF